MELAVHSDFIDEKFEDVFYSHQVTLKDNETKSLDA